MGKKKNKKKDIFGKKVGKKEKNRGVYKLSRDREYDDRPRPTIGKEARKEAAKAILKRIKIPDGIEKNRAMCNHAVPGEKLISPAEYRRMTAQADAFTPFLAAMVARYGENNVAICPSCYEALLINPALITMNDFDSARVILYAAINMAIGQLDGGKKGKNLDEIKKLSRLRDSIIGMGDVANLLEQAISDESDDDDDENNGLNANGGSMYS